MGEAGILPWLASMTTLPQASMSRPPLSVFFVAQVQEGRVKSMSSKEAGYAIQLSNYTVLDVRPSHEREKVPSNSGIFCCANVAFMRFC